MKGICSDIRYIFMCVHVCACVSFHMQVCRQLVKRWLALKLFAFMKTVWCIFRFRCLHFRLQQIFYAQRDNRQQTTKPAIIIHFAQNNVMHTWYLREFINTKQANHTHTHTHSHTCNTYKCMLCHRTALHSHISSIACIALIRLRICSHICFGRVAS